MEGWRRVTINESRVKKVTWKFIQRKRKVNFNLFASIISLWHVWTIFENCLIIVGTRYCDSEQEEEQKRYIEDTIKEVKRHNTGSLKPIGSVSDLLKSFEDPADPLPEIRKWAKKHFTEYHQVFKAKNLEIFSEDRL